MKYKKTLIFVAIIIVSAVLITNKVYAQLQLPRISTACEFKGGALHAFNDGFSLLESCPKFSRLVAIGEPQQGGSLPAEEIIVFEPQTLTDGKISKIIDVGEHKVITFTFGGGGRFGVEYSDNKTDWQQQIEIGGDSKQWVLFVQAKFYRVIARSYSPNPSFVSFVSAILD